MIEEQDPHHSVFEDPNLHHNDPDPHDWPGEGVDGGVDGWLPDGHESSQQQRHTKEQVPWYTPTAGHSSSHCLLVQ